MRLRAALLHVLVIASVATLAASILGASDHAQAAGSGEPAPIAVVIDPGHGGRPNNADPSQPYDPGAIGINGLLEKDVTLDVAKRTAVLLQADLVSASLTRSDDRYLTIDQREQVAIDAHAAVFVSVHCNSFKPDPSVGGSLVLYPNAGALPFAKTLSNALGADLAGAGIADGSVQLRDNWWIHAPMPTATVEMAYLSNPREAALMTTDAFRQQVAASIRDGIERFDPQIASRKAAILAWRLAHPPVASAPATPSVATAGAAGGAPRGSSPWATVFGWFVALASLAALVRWRATALRIAALIASLLLDGLHGTSLHHTLARRRRRRTRTRAGSRAQRWAPHSVYDELSL